MHPETSLPLWLDCKKQLQEYFVRKRFTFDLPYELEGSDFQKNVWAAMAKIPYGKTYSYKQLAEKVQNPKASRAVGNVCNKNPLPLIIPCHRVVYSNGKLGGFAMDLQIKENLLGFEQNLS
jgi:methylated-DNA-[protein]-cysteine S-methyltransferase